MSQQKRAHDSDIKVRLTPLPECQRQLRQSLKGQ